MLRTSITWRISMTATVMLKTGTATLGQSARNHSSATLPLRGWVWKELWSTACIVRSRLTLSPWLRHRYGSPPESMTSTKSQNAMSTFLWERSTSRHCGPCTGKEEAFKVPPLSYIFCCEDVRAKDKLMVEQQTLMGLLGAAMAGASIKLGESMMSLEMAAKSPDLPNSVRERIKAALDTLETGVCQ